MAIIDYSLSLDEGMRMLLEERSRLSLVYSSQLCADAHEFLRAGDSMNAEKLYRWAIKVSELLGSSKQEAFCSYDLGELLENTRKYSEAIGFYRKSLPYYLTTNDIREICRLHLRIYYCYENRHMFGEALEVLKEAMALLDEKGLELTAIINFYPAMIELCTRLEKNDQARQMAKILEDTETQFRAFKEARPVFERASAQSRKGKVKEALALMSEVELPIKNYADQIDQATFNLNLGGMLSDAARYDEATSVLRQAAKIYDETDNRDGKAKARKNLGSNYEDRGFYQAAIEEYRIAREILEETGDSEVLGRTLNDMGVLHKNLNLHMDALVHYTMAQEVFQDGAGAGDINDLKGNFEALFSKFRLRLSETLADDIALLLDRGAYAEIGKRLEAGNTPWERGDNVTSSQKLPTVDKIASTAAILRGANQLLELARQYLSQDEIELAVQEMWGAATSFQTAKDYQKAIELYYEVGAICEEQGRVHDLIQIGHQLGACMAQYGQLEDALHILLDTITEAEQRDLFPVLWQARLDVASVYEQLSQRDKAAAQLLLAIEEITNRAHLFKHVRTTEGFLADKTLHFQRLVDYLMDGGNHARAYDIVLKAKSWPFVRFINPIRNSSTIELETLAHQQSIYKRKSDKDVAPRRFYSYSIETRKWISEQDEMQLLAKACETNWKLPSHIDAVYLSPAQIINTLNDDTVLIDFFFTEHKLHIFTVTKQGIAGQTLELSQAAIYQRLLDIGFFYIDRKKRDWAAIPKVQVLLRAWLGEKLDATVAAHRVSNICFCPHGILHLLPLMALLNNSWEQVATTLKSQLKIVSWNVPHGAFLRAEGVQAGTAQDCYLGIGVISDLENTDVEVKSVSDYFEESKKKLLISERLDRDTIIREMREADVIHFACHAEFRDDFAELSYLDLGQGEQLRAIDVLSRAKIRAKLVVLSACWTSVGRVAPSDDVTSLARSFLYAGAEAVLATLWPVPDEETMNFIVDFFKLWVTDKHSLRTAFAQTTAIHQNDPTVASAFVLLEAPRK
jgi:CHAT domain-containing protein